MNPLFQPSNLNNQFHGDTNLSFANYVEQTRQMIAKARLDLTSDHAEFILDANAPKEWSTSHKPKQGLLLVHGLYDSPFLMRDLGDYFAQQGLLVRSILLPGHGTVPGDLLNVEYGEWLKAVDYGVETFAKEVEQIFILGFSLGALLAVHKALEDNRIQGLLLFCPAFEIRKQWLVRYLLQGQRWLRQIFPNLQWHIKRNFQKDITRYESFTSNSAQQIYQLILKTENCLKQKPLDIPVFLVVSEQDEVISPTRCLTFFTSHSNPNSRLLWYAKDARVMHDTRIIVKNSVFPTQKILDFSHIGLPVSFDNVHYGRLGDYRNFLKYPDNKAPLHREIFLGAVSKENMKKGVIQRLSYNPDFKEMTEMMGEWLRNVSHIRPHP